MRSASIATALTSLLLLVMAASPSFAEAGNQAAVQQATRAAKSWLKLMDTGKYKVAYRETSTFLKDHVPENAFVQETRATLTPFGSVKSRNLEVAKYATSLPGAPDGEYVVMQFSTSFTKKEDAIETVTEMKEPHGKWRIAGYYVR